jgi:hypothetical protein
VTFRTKYPRSGRKVSLYYGIAGILAEWTLIAEPLYYEIAGILAEWTLLPTMDDCNVSE